MSENLFKVSKHYIGLSNFKSSDFSLKNSNLYAFSDALENKIKSSAYTFANNVAGDPQPPTNNYVLAGSIEEYPSILKDLDDKYSGKYTYYPLCSNLYGYCKNISEDRDTLLSSRVPYLQSLPSNLSFNEYPSFFDGMSSFSMKDCTKVDTFYTNSSRSTAVSTTNYLVETPYFLCSSSIASKTATLTVYSKNITLTESRKYTLSFYVRRATSTKSEGTLTITSYVNGSAVSGVYYSDSQGYNTSNLKFTDVWERGSFTFQATAGTCYFVVTIPANTRIGGFLVESSDQGGPYNEILVNEASASTSLTYCPMAIKLQNNISNTTESLSADWSISFTKVGGQNTSYERIGNLVFTENLGSIDKISSDDKKGSISVGYISGTTITNIATKTFTRPWGVTNNFSTRRYSLVYTKSSNTLNIYVTFNYVTTLVGTITDTRITTYLPSIISEAFTKSGASLTWQYHLILGGTSPTNLCNSTRYRDLIFIRKALTLSEITELETKSLTVSSGKSHYECDVVTRNSTGEITSTTKKEDRTSSTITYLTSSIIINKET